MEEVKKKMDYVFDGVFYFLGFTENPAAKAAKETIRGSASEKIKTDLKRINDSYREQYKKLRKEVMCIEQE